MKKSTKKLKITIFVGFRYIKFDRNLLSHIFEIFRKNLNNTKHYCREAPN